LEVEVLCDENGHYCLVEINPRFPAWIYLSHGVGRNLPQLLIDLIQGEPPPIFEPPEVGMLFIRYAQETLLNLKQFESMIVHGGLDDSKLTDQK
jgi:carbamoyl-phosphate synthase large subunit